MKFLPALAPPCRSSPAAAPVSLHARPEHTILRFEVLPGSFSSAHMGSFMKGPVEATLDMADKSGSTR